jgi:hypothetical protein
MSCDRTNGLGVASALRPRGLARRRVVRHSVVTVLAVAGLLATAACTSSRTTPAAAGSGPGTPASGSGQGGTSSPGTQPGIVAITTGGALVVLNPSTGAVTRTLVPSGVAIPPSGPVDADEIAVSPDGSTVYFSSYANCTNSIESVPVSGGTPTVITTGELPAISPNGSELAFTRQDDGDCNGSQDWAQNYSVVIRNLGPRSQTVYPMKPDDTGQTLPDPIVQLSWAPGGRDLAVSIGSFQDNFGYNLILLSPGTAQFYSTGPGTTSVPVTGSPDASGSYYNDAAYLPDGNLFVNRDCCIGVGGPDHTPPTDSNLMQEISSSGSLVRTVAIGVQQDEHTSLSVDPTGNWLLYVAGTAGYTTADGNVPPTGSLYVSQGGARPTQLATGILAAAWL